MMAKERFINGKWRMPDEKCKPNLGCATTKELLDELKARIKMDGTRIKELEDRIKLLMGREDIETPERTIGD